MNRRPLAAVLALSAGLFWLPGALPAQEDEVLEAPTAMPAGPEMPPSSEVVMPQNEFPVEAPPAGPGGWVPAPQAPPKEHWWHGPVCTWLRDKTCWTHHNCHGCGTVKSDCTFIFGSCREFFGEPCFKSPPPQLVPVGYEPPQAGSSCASCKQ